MLKIADTLVPQSLLSYVAFRVAARETIETIATLGLDGTPDPTDLTCAYLSEIPFLREVALPVQLEVLAGTWDRHFSPEVFEGTLLDESVLYAACELTATLAEQSPERITRALRGGPLDVTLVIDHQLASELRGIYLHLPNDGDFLLISQLLDFPPEECADWKERLGLSDSRLDCLFELLGRWYVQPEMIGCFRGLVGLGELQPIAKALGVTSPA